MKAKELATSLPDEIRGLLSGAELCDCSGRSCATVLRDEVAGFATNE